MDLAWGEQWPMMVRLLLATLLGALVGIEREYRGYAAGVRTLALVALGAAFFGEESLLFGGQDRARVAAQIVSGIGFLGAGVIVREGLSVHGVTTAATIWATASIGLAVAAHAYLVAGFAVLLAIAVLESHPLARFVRERGHAYEEETAHREE